MPTCIKYLETRTCGEQLIDVTIKSTLEDKKRGSIETGSSIEVRGTLDTRMAGDPCFIRLKRSTEASYKRMCCRI